MTYKNYRRYTQHNDLYKLIRKFMRVVPDYLPKFNAIIDSPDAVSDVWIMTEMKKIIDEVEKQKAGAPGVEVGSA